MKKHPKIKLLTTKYSDGDKLKALSITQDIVTANPEIKGVYGTNEGSAVGVGRAISEMGKSDSIAVVGVDSSAEEVELLKEGAIDAMVVQDPFNMGYTAVKTAIAAAHGETVEKRIDTGSTVVTLDNLETEEVQKILYPFGKK
jgi:ribose transport system substrate-binding protein